jgi:hypothetical protein
MLVNVENVESVARSDNTFGHSVPGRQGVALVIAVLVAIVIVGG